MKRSEIDNAMKWNITDVYASNEDFNKDFEKASQEISAFESYKDSLTKSSTSLYECLKKRDELQVLVERVYTYAHLKRDEDSRESFYQGLAIKVDGLATKFGTSISFIEPTLLSMDEQTLNTYMSENNDLTLYKHYFDNLFREKKHVLSIETEALLAEVSEIANAPKNIFSMLNNADMKFSTILNENDEEIEVTHGKYVSLLESANRRVREDAFNSCYDSYIKQKNTIASTYASSVKKDIFLSRTRKYESSLHASLSSDNIPVSVYKNLIETVNKYLPAMHRYISLRKKRLELNELHMYDLYTPIVKNADTHVDFDTAKDTILKGLEPLGSEYLSIVKKGFDERWIDVYENEGKRSGAYSWGTYSCHPFVLMNYDNKVGDMFTLAHEMGHALHSHYASSTQPSIYSDYSIFLAEIASTVNEALLMEYLLKTETDTSKKEYLLNLFMEDFRNTLFRQTMFAEFELIAHEMSERGEPLTSDVLHKLHYDLNVKYYGKDIVVDDKIGFEWSRIPHFYRPFYVFQYATGYSASIAISRKILEDPKSVDSYIEMLKSGSSEYSIETLKKAGVDMSSPDPICDALDVFESLVTQFESL